MNKFQKDLNKQVKNSRKLLSYYRWRKVTKSILFDGKKYFAKNI